MNNLRASVDLPFNTAVKGENAEREMSTSSAICQPQSCLELKLDHFDAKSTPLEENRLGNVDSLENSPPYNATGNEAQRGKNKRIHEKPNHSEVEKQRRHKMNKLIEEMALVIPMTSNSHRKPDKLTILRMAVQNVRLHIEADNEDPTSEHFKPQHLKEVELQALLECATEGFLFIASVDQYQILFMSDKVQDILGFSAASMIGKHLLDLLHPKDIKTFKDQFTFRQVSGSGSFHSSLCNDSEEETKDQDAIIFRRDFFCRLRHNRSQGEDVASMQHKHVIGKPKAKAYNLNDVDMKDYCVVHCAGYLKSWLLPGGHTSSDKDASFISCFYGIGRKIEIFSENVPRKKMSHDLLEFAARCSTHGKYLYVDHRMVAVLGYLPQDLIGQILYDFVHQDDVFALRKTIANVDKLQSLESIVSGRYRMIAKNGSLVNMIAVLYNFRNPVTEDIEFICMHSAVLQ